LLIIRDKSPLPPNLRGSAIALGNFAGLHLGHQSVIQKTIEHARELGKPAAILTFEPHPRRIFKPELPPLRIISFSEKIRILKELGIDFMRVIRFTREFSTTTAEAFIRNILVGELGASHVVTGDDFVFGYKRTGNAEYLQKMAHELDFGYTACPPLLVGGERCSSTRVREALSQGNMALTEMLLGRPYNITGIVREGDKRGRQLGFPTANILPGRIFTPAIGVYAIRAKVLRQQLNGVANFGVRPTFNGARLQLEVHLFDWNQDIYGEHMEVNFVEFIRPEKKFDGIEALKKQIAEDSEKAKNLLSK